MSEQVQTPEVLFELSGVGVVETDMQTGRFRRANTVFCEMVGYSERELRGMTYLELTHPDDRECDAERFAALRRNEVQRSTSLTRVLHKDGQVVWLELHATLISEGKGARNLTVVNDVTERKRSEETLQQSEEKYRTLFGLMDEGYILTEVIFDANEEPVDIRYLEANPAAVAMTGTELVGKTTREVDPNFETHWFETYGRVAKTGVGERHEFTAAPLGAIYTIYIFKVGAKEETEVAAVYQDITERKRAEEALRRAAERDAFRVTLNDALRPLSDPVRVQAEACRLLGEHLGVDRAYYVEVNEAERYALVYQDYLRGDSPSLAGSFRLTDYGWTVPLLQRGEAIIVTDAETSDLVPEADRAAMAAVRIVAHISIPLVKGGVLVGALCVTETAPRGWLEIEIELVRETAERIWAVVERVRAEQALRDSEARFRAFVMTTSDVVYSMSADWTEVRFLVGKDFIPDTDVPNSSWLENYIPPDDQPQVFGVINEAIRTKSAFELEHRVVCVDGSLGWAHSRAIPLLGASGDITGWFGTARDVTERKRAEQALRESEERLTLALEAARMGEWSLDLTTGEATHSALHDRIFGYEEPLSEWTFETFLGHVYPDDRAFVTEVFERSRRTGEDWEFECRITRTDGEARWVWALGSARGDVASGEGARVYGLVTDVTERKRDEDALRDLTHTLEQRVAERTEALKNSERRFSQAFYVNPIPACMTTFERETFVEVNDAFLELTGYSRDEVVGRASRELGMWSSAEDQRKLGKAQREEKGFRNLELSLRNKDGGVHTVLLSAAVIRLDSDEGYLKMFYDITERKQTEEQLHRAIQEVMSDASWFSRSLFEQLGRIRSGGREEGERVALSKRERQVLERLAAGMANDAIAADLGLSPQTVRNYISNIYDKLGVRSRAEAIVWARERGFSA